MASIFVECRNFLNRTRYISIAVIGILAMVVVFNFLVVRQEEILRKYFITMPEETQKEYNADLSVSISKCFIHDNRSSDLAVISDYIKKISSTQGANIYFIFRDDRGDLRQVGRTGMTTVSGDVLSGSNVYPVTISDGKIEGYLLILFREADNKGIKEGLARYTIMSYSLRLVFFLLVSALLLVVFYYDYSSKMKLARDMAVIKASNDGLTGMYTHEYFKKALAVEMERSRLDDVPLALLMLDIDHFKALNDNYGHQTGDAALQGASRMIKACTRAADILARYGGEEFSIIMPYIERPSAGAIQVSREDFIVQVEAVAERIRKNIESTPVYYGGKAITMTISIGVAFFSKGTGHDSQERFVERADRALYTAKRSGRNKVVIDRVFV